MRETENLGLPLLDPSDLVKRSDFNDAAKILDEKVGLSPELCAMFSLAEGAAPVDALKRLLLSDGRYAVKVQVLSPGGRPMKGVEIGNSLVSMSGQPLITGEDGTCVGFTASNPVTVSATNNFLDISSIGSVKKTLTDGILNEVTLTSTRDSAMETSKTFTASQNVRFSPDVATFNCSAIGGGANGAAGVTGSSTISGYSAVTATGGKGGNAGQVVNKAGILNTSQLISIVVGAIGGTSRVGTYITAAGAAGAAGGAGGYAWSNANSVYANNHGSTNAGAGADTTTSFLYPPTDVGGAGGGGFAHTDFGGSYSSDASAARGIGGSPGGGEGAASQSSNGDNASHYGGGGGGGAAEYYSGKGWNSSGGSGMQGLCGLQWAYKGDDE